MKTIAFVSQKGGAGKTSLAVSLAVAVAQTGETVIAIDLDPQGSLSAWGDDHLADTCRRGNVQGHYWQRRSWS